MLQEKKNYQNPKEVSLTIPEKLSLGVGNHRQENRCLVPRFHNMKNHFWAVGHWSGLDCEIKGSGPIMSNF